jgi:hypothetical protein
MFLRATRLWREGTRDPIRSASLLILAISSIAFAVWLVSLTRREWFVYDEFDYLQPSGESLVTWLLRPHNEHTITFTKASFGSLSSILGLRGYGLYIGPLIVSHLVAVWLIYRLTWISTASRILASGIALVALTMGAAAGTLTWAGQLQYTGSVAAGLGAILLACQRPGRRDSGSGCDNHIWDTQRHRLPRIWTCSRDNVRCPPPMARGNDRRSSRVCLSE